MIKIERYLMMQLGKIYLGSNNIGCKVRKDYK